MEDNIAAIVEQLKSKGNDSYQEKRFEEAIGFYSEAIDIINNSNSNSSGNNRDDNNDSNNDRDQDLNGESCSKKNVNQINGNDRLDELHDKVKELNDDQDDDDLLDALDNGDNNDIESHESHDSISTTSVPTVSNSIVSNIIDNQSKELVKDILTKCLMNRSICYSQMKLYDLSNIDAKRVLPLTYHKNNNNHHKAFYRLIKNSFDTKSYRDVRFYLSQAIKECGGEHKDFQQFEEELITHTGIPLRPKSTDFEVISELGTGNFSTVYKVMYKRTKRLYAMKVIDVTLVILIILLLIIDISSSI